MGVWDYIKSKFSTNKCDCDYISSSGSKVSINPTVDKKGNLYLGFFTTGMGVDQFRWSGIKLNSYDSVSLKAVQVDSSHQTILAFDKNNAYFKTRNGSDFWGVRWDSGLETFDILTKNDACINFNDANRIRIARSKTPSSSTDVGSIGEICWDNTYVYVCIAMNTWKRSIIETW